MEWINYEQGKFFNRVIDFCSDLFYNELINARLFKGGTMRSEDIAKLAGVSRSTVSRVINNYSNVPEETRAKVLKVIEQHQYEPNSLPALV